MGKTTPKAWEADGLKSTGDMVFASLHHHTTFSTGDGYGTPEAHAERGAELGLGAMAFTEHGNVSSLVRAEQACDKHGIQMIPGCEIYAGQIEEEKRTQRKNHLTVLAETDEGYKNLLRLVSRGWAEGFYYEPTVSGSMLREHAEGLIVLSGCASSLLSTSIVGGKNIEPGDASYERGKRVADRARSSLDGAYYLEVQAFPELGKTCTINKAIAQIGEELGIPLVATLDVHYTRPEESEMQQILHATRRRGKKQTFEERAREWSYDVKLTIPDGNAFDPGMYPEGKVRGNISDRVIFERLVATGLTKKQAAEAIRNTRVIAERCQGVRLPKMENLTYPLPPDVADSHALFRRWCNEGWKYRGFSKLDPGEKQRYMEQAQYEMHLIEKLGFVDYFLIVSDICKFAKDSGIPVGPARGSAAASLVCFMLRITEVDPMLYPTLVFARFIDENRHDLPDIDLDFDDELRYLVDDYVIAKYGKERVGNIASFVMYKGKNSLDDVAKVFEVPSWEVEKLKNLLIERASGDLRADATIEDTVESFPDAARVIEEYPRLMEATRLEGNMKNISVHAAGLVLANGPITDVCAVYTKMDDKTGLPRIDEHGNVEQVVSVDKYDAEYLNVLKLDRLGLITMGALRLMYEAIGEDLEFLYAIPMDDEEVYRGFQEGDVVGVFQFDGRAMRSVNSGVLPDNFMEVADVNALARPGPLHSGATAEYISVKHGRVEAEHYHPIVDDITKPTNWQIVYQEQILRVCRELGNFSWEESGRIRKIISKKRGEQEFNTMRAKFIEGAAEHGLDEEGANRVFSLLATAGAYAFNAAHCVSYGILAYWTMWFKRHYPIVFYMGMLRKCKNNKEGREKQQQLLRDAAKKGIKVKAPHMNKSDTNWSIDEGCLRAGFVQILGVGDKTAAALLHRREELGGFDGWGDVQSVHGVGDKTIIAMQDFISSPDPFDLELLNKKLQEVRDLLERGAFGDLPVPTHRSVDIPYERQPYNVEVVWLGVIRDRNLKDLFELHHSRTGEHLDPTTTKDPHLNEWVVMMGEDDTEPVVVTINRWRYNSLKESAWNIKLNHDIVLVRGLKYGVQDRRAIYVTDMWVFDPEGE